MKISKLFLIFIFSAILSNCLYAQKYKWEFAIEGGAGIRDISFNPSYPSLETETGLGYLAGISGQYNFDEMWSMKLGADYERKGTDFKRTDLGTTGRVNLDYITFPLLLKVKLGRKIKYFANFGPYLGLFLKNQTTIDAYGNTPEVVMKVDSTTKKIDFGISSGIGIEVPVGRSGAFTVELRDNFGLTNISESKETNAPKLKLNNLLMIVGYIFKF